MRIDAYTKFVLSVIALCLIWLSLGGPALLPNVSAQTKQPTPITGYNRVVIAGWLDERGGEHPFPVNSYYPQGVPVVIVGGGR